MHSYLLIESRDPFESTDVAHFSQLASDLAVAGNTVTLLLVQNAVLPARRDARNTGLAALLDTGVKVLADEFALRERAIGTHQLAPGIVPTNLEIVVDQLAAGAKAIWH